MGVVALVVPGQDWLNKLPHAMGSHKGEKGEGEENRVISV